MVIPSNAAHEGLMFTPDAAASPTRLVVLGQEMTLVETNAPDAYDYVGVTLVGDQAPGQGETRLVLIPTTGLDFQIARYRSGLYFGVPSDLHSADDIARLLFPRLQQRGGL